MPHESAVFLRSFRKCSSIKEKKLKLTKTYKSFQKLRGERCKSGKNRSFAGVLDSNASPLTKTISKALRSRSWQPGSTGRPWAAFFVGGGCSHCRLCCICPAFLGGVGNSFFHAFRVYLPCDQRKEAAKSTKTTHNTCKKGGPE